MHHAELHIGTTDTVLDSLDHAYRSPSADVFHLIHERFGIGEARHLKEMAFQRPVEREYRTFVVGARSMTTEAQNALLKLFEEPPTTARFYVVVPREEILIETLRSRLAKPTEALPDAHLENDDALTFLKSAYKNRLATVAARMKEKDTEWAESILSGSEVFFSEKGDYDALQEIVFVRKYFHTPGASKKMLLEHLALTLSVVV